MTFFFFTLHPIQCEKLSKSEEALKRLREGEKFDVVAREMSEDKANRGMFIYLFPIYLFMTDDSHTCGTRRMPAPLTGGSSIAGHGHVVMLTRLPGGSLGWQTKGSLDPKFEEVAFQLPPSSVSSPQFGTVKTQFGYHIIMVEDRK